MAKSNKKRENCCLRPDSEIARDDDEIKRRRNKQNSCPDLIEQCEQNKFVRRARKFSAFFIVDL